MNIAVSVTREIVTTETKTVDPSALSLREVLDIIDARLAVGDLVSRDLANVISAVRGLDVPKAERGASKTGATAVIRSAAFPLTAQSSAAKARNGWDFNPAIDVVPGNVNKHFRCHAKQAARALGLTFDGQPVDYNAKITTA